MFDKVDLIYNILHSRKLSVGIMMALKGEIRTLTEDRMQNVDHTPEQKSSFPTNSPKIAF